MTLKVVDAATSQLLSKSIQKNSDLNAKSLQRLATGLRVNSAADDAAALAIGSRLIADNIEVRSFQQNAGQGASLLQITDGALSQQQTLVDRAKEISVQAANGTLSDSDRAALNTEFKSVVSEIDRLAKDTEFNSQKVLQGSTFDFRVGDFDSISVTVDPSDSASLNIDTLDVSTVAGADAAIAALDTAATNIIKNQASVGAAQNSLSSAQDNLAVASENFDAAQSALLDANVAEEVSKKAASQLLLKSSVSTLVQGNNSQYDVLSLLS